MDLALIDATSAPFLGQWKRLVSTTNWEKGQIIHHWREALEAAGAPVGDFSDEAWARQVGHVTPQHVGRLRRVFERFGEVRGQYEGLYWSHFQAALDWDDAEMWLEGAVQNGWSISEMRHQRFETLGAVEGENGAAADEADANAWDEDAEASADEEVGTLGVVRAPDQAEADEDAQYDHAQFDDEEAPADDDASAERGELIRPFATLPSLPADVNDAFESYKLCILRHKLAGWVELSRDDMLASLDALKQLALAPGEA